jgi:phage tail sheath protein FI
MARAKRRRRRRGRTGGGRVPGVFVDEVPSGSRPIESVGTSVATFVGLARRHPVLTGAFALLLAWGAAAAATSRTRRTASILG